ncbi:MAG: hypothetical protein O7E52_13970 [Candidatus Poribacteria bacterium]|nr:hypothetical protein [Candidatus Poribacteria bacterium]
MELTKELKQIYVETASKLKGRERRIFMAQVVAALGHGGQQKAMNELGWHQDAIRRGTDELESEIRCEEQLAPAGRKHAEHHLPDLLSDIEITINGQNQTNSTCDAIRLYSRGNASEDDCQLIEQKEHTDEELRAKGTIYVKLNPAAAPAVSPKIVLKEKLQFDDIFDQLDEIHTDRDTKGTANMIACAKTM